MGQQLLLLRRITQPVTNEPLAKSTAAIKKPKRIRRAILVFAGLLFLAFLVRRPKTTEVHSLEKVALTPQMIQRATIAKALESKLALGEYPASILLGDKTAAITYTFDSDAQAAMEGLFKKYHPDYGAFAAIDAQTGKILSLVSYTNKKSTLGNLALRAIFPAASVFKIVTAAAALDQSRLSPQSSISFGGRNHTLYRNQVLKNRSYGERLMSMKEAFARSVNTVFGKVGVFFLRPGELEAYSRKFLFQDAMALDFPLESKSVRVASEDPFRTAELASGFDREARLSPLHGALLAAAMTNDGVLREPHLVEKLIAPDGSVIYQAAESEFTLPIHAKTAAQMREMMRETVRSGTARRSFRGAFEKFNRAGIEVGGKTGSLTSLDPKGKCDWFVGYGSLPSSRIAFAALTVNVDKWQVKSSYLAREFLEHWYSKKRMATLAYGPMPK